MTRTHHLLAALLVSTGMGAGATAALADCASELDSLTQGAAKNGTMAPLADTATPQTGSMAAAPKADTNGTSKDGTGMPMNSNPDVATSGQDAQAQSEGGKTAAAQAMGAGGGDTRQAALDEARAALAKGDESACMAAVARAKGM